MKSVELTLVKTFGDHLFVEATTRASRLLQEAGFKPGQKVTIVATEDLLEQGVVLENRPEDPPPPFTWWLCYRTFSPHSGDPFLRVLARTADEAFALANADNPTPRYISARTLDPRAHPANVAKAARKATW